MNEFERRNLERLRTTSDKAADLIRELQAEGLREETLRIIRVIVHSYFDEEKGDAAAVKRRLREDFDLYQQLHLTDQANATYTNIQQQREQFEAGRWNDQTHAAFGQWFAEHRRACREKHIG